MPEEKEQKTYSQNSCDIYLLENDELTSNWCSYGSYDDYAFKTVFPRIQFLLLVMKKSLENGMTSEKSGVVYILNQDESKENPRFFSMSRISFLVGFVS